ncbi:substrate-binding domain-containing protein [Glaciibacter superstes]|uniref:substrate-binding domain-containing protein n=1 Tax=Glaciibacter superstes TaxID=501023 RepID=UPI0003B41A21|nr:substrate-binding domain-containing protein [Glaciibacter superstes]
MLDQPIRVGVVEKNRSPYWDMVNAGWLDAASALGLDLVIRAPEHEDIDVQRTMLEQLLDDGVDALAFVGTVEAAFDAVLESARNRGVSVVSFDLDASRDHRSIFVGMTHPKEIGRRVGERIAADVGPGALVLLLAGSADARGAVGKLRGLTAALEAGGVSVAVSSPDGEDLAVATRNARDLLAAHPTAAAAIGVYGYHPAVLAGAAADIGSSVRIHGFDMLPETVELLRSGAVESSVWIREYYFGYLAAVAVHDLHRLGSDEVLALFGGIADGAGKSLELEPRTYTRNNVEEFVRWRDEHDLDARTARTLIPKTW